MNINKSISLFQEALTLLPGGVDSPVRAFRAVGGQPLFIECGEGPYLYDVDGNRYIDYVEYLLMKDEQEEKKDWVSLSLSSAMRDMEEEAVSYSLADLRVTFG